MDWRLELVVVPVTDVDRAKSFYVEKAGFVLDHDRINGAMRVVQLTPPGSACSIAVGTGLGDARPGSLKGIQLVVPDLPTTRAELAARGLDISDVKVYDAGGFRPAVDGDDLTNVGFAFFSDPDGNTWAVQHIPNREQCKLELVVVPVADVDRAKRFYADQVGFTVDFDSVDGAARAVQLTPRGSGCSIAVGTGLVDSAPGSLKGLQLVVTDIEAARAELVERGVEVSDVHHFGEGPGSAFVFFNDPDGNAWAVQELPPLSQRSAPQ